MAFNTFDYMFFLSAVAIIYYILPQKVKKVWLLAVSLAFYALWDVRYLAVIGTNIVVTYMAGRLIEKNADRKKLCKTVVALVAIICIGSLAVFKYSSFLVGNINKVFGILGVGAQIPVLEIMLSIGISFFTFQSLGYVIDIYRGKYAAEKNIIIYALFLSFFPQICCGPIGRGDKLLPQYHADVTYDVDRIREGLLTIAYGLFLKMVIADNINALISPMFASWQDYNGMELLLATLLIGIQIYCDFYGYSLMALGSGRVLQIELMRNFNQPYLATSFKEFWRDWHVSLTSWFTEYLYIPLGGNRKGRIRKYVNQLIVFICSGLWHGAGWHYIAWGGLNGVYLGVEDMFGEKLGRLMEKLGANRSRKSWKLVKWVFTVAFISVGMLLFQASSLSDAFRIMNVIVRDFRPGWFFAERCYSTFASTQQFAIIIFSMIVMGVVDWLNKKGKNVIQLIFRQQVIIRWCVYLLLLYIIVCWGAYGEGFEQTQFIYFEF